MSPTLLWMLLTMATNEPNAAAPKAPPPAAAACSDPAYRQFDFWLGEWTVHGKAGRPVGRSRIESVLGGCAIAETWTSGSGPANDGRSLNQYQAGTKQWEQYWVDAQDGRLLLRGGLQGSAMVLASEDGAAHQRITWTPNEDGSVRQLWESSTDGGATWTVAFDGLYRRAAGG
jgi:hypothetical protein